MKISADYKNETGCSHLAVAMLVMLIILGAVERIYGIDRQSLWSDELFAVMASYKSSYADVWNLMLGDSHPPGYVSFMYWTLPLTGYTDIAIRMHAFLFGILWIPLVFWLGKRWFSVNVGLLAAAVVASAYNAVYYSQEARAYTMLIVFNLINLICLFEILFTENKLRRYIIGFIVSTLTMLYLHYTGFVFLAAEVLLYGIFWVARQRCGSIREALILFGIPLLLYSPWLGVMYENMVDAPRDWSVSQIPTLDEAYNTLQRLLGPDDSHMEFHVVFISLALLSAVIEHIKHGLSKKLMVVYSLFFLMTAPIIAFYVQSLIATPIFEKRYFLAALVIEAILIAGVAGQIIDLADKKFQKIALVLAVIIFSVWTINSNILAKLYTIADKDPIREAVGIVRDDLGGKRTDKNYTVLMTHDWFEHYLKRSGISYDKSWTSRYFYIPQQIESVNNYLLKNSNIDYFYYLSLRQKNSEAALFSLMQSYKMLSKSEVSIEQGTIDVFKFSTKILPDAEQLKEAGSNSSNEIAKIVAQDVGQKDPATYRVLVTHDWVLPYLRRNGVKVDHESGGGSYVVNAQSDGIFRYINNHPEIDTLYYLALQEPNAEGAMFMLQSRYLLASEQSVETSVGKMNILKFDVKSGSVDAASLHLRRKGSRINGVAELLAENIRKAPQEKYFVAMAYSWFEPYVKQNGVFIDEKQGERIFNGIGQEAAFFAYLKAHPEIKHLYYLALLEPGLQPTLDLLKSRMALTCEQTVEIAIGKVSLMKFDVTAKPGSAGMKVSNCES